MYINTTTLTQHSESEIRALNPDTSFPNPFVPPEDYALVFPSPQPNFDPTTHRVQAGVAELTTLGHWEQRWSIAALTDEEVAANQAAAQAQAELAEASRIAALWQAAHDYEFAQISGSAIGLLAIGVMQGLPKCQAVQAWVKGIWVIYYGRRASTSSDTDFSLAGTCPHSVPELMAELGI